MTRLFDVFKESYNSKLFFERVGVTYERSGGMVIPSCCNEEVFFSSKEFKYLMDLKSRDKIPLSSYKNKILIGPYSHYQDKILPTPLNKDLYINKENPSIVHVRLMKSSKMYDYVTYKIGFNFVIEEQHHPCNVEQGIKNPPLTSIYFNDIEIFSYLQEKDVISRNLLYYRTHDDED